MSLELPPKPRVFNAKRSKLAIVASSYNERFTNALVDSVIDELGDFLPQARVDLVRVPGAFEIPVVIRSLLDLDQPTMDYGLQKHIEPLGEDAKRIELLNRNVLDGTKRKFDIIAAFNFSYSVFKTRAELLSYFQTAHRDLAKDGAFFIDLYGGPESQEEVEETQKLKGFTYVWDQEPIDAITHWGLRHIHFRFPDGSEMKKAFTYDWRLWTLPELCDLMDDAGFSSWDVYWEGADKKGNGDGVFKKQAHAENEDAWIAYLVGWR